ncbi:MAG: hypothetical protein FD137_604 [Spirochaetes bacterium]|nr:MAG: hypothetical protein FD137_604 [Spirochaetota bacterium]
MGRQKLLLPMDGVSVVARTAWILAQVFSPLVLVIGSDGPRVKAEASGIPGLHVVQNPDWEEGMTGSLQRGLAGLRKQLETQPGGFFIHHGDMPFLSPALLKEISRAAAKDEDSPLFPRLRGSEPSLLGHPVYAPFRLEAKIHALKSGERIRDLLLKESYRIYETSDPAILEDLDTPEAYAALCRKYGLSGDFLP